MNIFEQIKSDKTMSFNHWRYRILHWCFGETAKTPEESGISQIFYKAYCPLFHVTNLIAILVPLIIVVKITVAVVKGVVKVCGLIPFERLESYQIIKKRELTHEEKVRADKKYFVERMRFIQSYHPGFYNRFGPIWDRMDEIQQMSEEECEAFYNQLMEKKEKKEKEVEARKKLMEERMLFWSYISNICLKPIFTLLYIVLAIGLCVGSVVAVPYVFGGVWWFLSTLWSVDVLVFFLLVVKLLVLISVPIIIVAMIVSSESAKSYISKSTSTIFRPLIFCGPMIAAPFKWFFATFSGLAEFIQMFYKENCPLITIEEE